MLYAGKLFRLILKQIIIDIYVWTTRRAVYTIGEYRSLFVLARTFTMYKIYLEKLGRRRFRSKVVVDEQRIASSSDMWRRMRTYDIRT